VIAPRRTLAFVALVAIALGSTATMAQQPHGKGRGRPKKPTVDAGAVAPESAEKPSPAATEEVKKSDGGVVEAKTLDGGTRVFRFGEVEIEGRMRNPQLVYFLRRVRAEFAAGDLGHRSFMRELSDTRHDPSF
jgi:hypothetical protein